MDPRSPGSDPRPRRILLVDCDAFYVQVARLEDPEGAGRAELLIVGGSSDGRGVVTSASYACREYGVHSAMPTAQALRLCPAATVVPVPRGACSARSRAVREALEALSPVVQAASIDEFYLDFTGTERLLKGESLADTGRRLQAHVFQASGIRVSVGGGTNRLVAKLAVSRAKPNGVFVVPPGGEAAFVAELALGDLPGVGPALMETLSAKGLTTVREALRVDPEWMTRWLGESRARWLRDRMLGRDDTPVRSRDPRKSISSERTFSRDLASDEELENQLLRLTVSVAASLRDEGLRARTLTVKLRDRDFTTRQRSHTFPEAVTSERVLYPEARRLLSELRARRRVPARLLGVGLSTLEEGDAPQQLGLFADRDEGPGAPKETDRDRTLSRVVDDLRARFGDDAVLPGRIAGTDPPGRRKRSGGSGSEDPGSR